MHTDSCGKLLRGFLSISVAPHFTSRIWYMLASTHLIIHSLHSTHSMLASDDYRLAFVLICHCSLAKDSLSISILWLTGELGLPNFNSSLLDAEKKTLSSLKPEAEDTLLGVRNCSLGAPAMRSPCKVSCKESSCCSSWQSHAASPSITWEAPLRPADASGSGILPCSAVEACNPLLPPHAPSPDTGVPGLHCVCSGKRISGLLTEQWSRIHCSVPCTMCWPAGVWGERLSHAGHADLLRAGDGRSGRSQFSGVVPASSVMSPPISSPKFVVA